MRSNFKYIVTVIAFTALFSSCLMEDAEQINKKTEPGFFTYAYTTDMVMSQYLFCLDMAVKMDDFLLETDDLKKDEIEDMFFPAYKVRHNGDTTVLVNVHYGVDSRFDIKFLTRGTSLRDENAHWSVLLGGKDKWVDIYRNTASEYRVQAEEVRLNESVLIGSTELVVSVSKLEDKDVDENSVYNYLISGKGSYVEKMVPNGVSSYSTYYVEYMFEDKLAAYLIPELYTNYLYINMFRYHDGVLSMTLSGEEVVDKKQIIRAELSSEMYVPVLEITYRGVTETWELYDHRTSRY